MAALRGWFGPRTTRASRAFSLGVRSSHSAATRGHDTVSTASPKSWAVPSCSAIVAPSPFGRTAVTRVPVTMRTPADSTWRRSAGRMASYPPRTCPMDSCFMPDCRAPYMRTMMAQMNAALASSALGPSLLRSSGSQICSTVRRPDQRDSHSSAVTCSSRCQSRMRDAANMVRPRRSFPSSDSGGNRRKSSADDIEYHRRRRRSLCACSPTPSDRPARSRPATRGAGGRCRAPRDRNDPSVRPRGRRPTQVPRRCVLPRTPSRDDPAARAAEHM